MRLPAREKPEVDRADFPSVAADERLVPVGDVLPPFVLYRVDRFDERDFEVEAGRLRQRMRALETTSPIPYRRQNGGDYLIPSMQLRPGLEDKNATGFAVHLNGNLQPTRRVR